MVLQLAFHHLARLRDHFRVVAGQLHDLQTITQRRQRIA
jgi:hypothetical protein